MVFSVDGKCQTLATGVRCNATCVFELLSASLDWHGSATICAYCFIYSLHTAMCSTLLMLSEVGLVRIGVVFWLALASLSTMLISLTPVVREWMHSGDPLTTSWDRWIYLGEDDTGF